MINYHILVTKTNSMFVAQLMISQLNIVVTTVTTKDALNQLNIILPSQTHIVVLVGRILAFRAVHAGIKYVGFNRHKHKYHGIVKKLAETVRNYGLTM